MRGIVIFDGKRNQSAPQVPTSAEAGMPQLTAVNWYALLAPAGTPRPIIERLNVESVRVMNTPETRASLAAMGGTPDASAPEEGADFMRAEYAPGARSFAKRTSGSSRPMSVPAPGLATSPRPGIACRCRRCRSHGGGGGQRLIWRVPARLPDTPPSRAPVSAAELQIRGRPLTFRGSYANLICVKNALAPRA